MKATFQAQTIYREDFLRGWQQVPDGSIDLVLTDPPFGTLTSSQPWDVRPDFHVLGGIFANLIKPGGQVAVFCDFATATEIESGFSRYFDFRFNWVWQKPSVIPINRSRPANDIELILVYKVKDGRIKDLTFNLDAIRQEGKPYTRPAGKSQNKNPTRRGGGNMPEVFANTTGDRFPRSIVKFNNKPCLTKKERVPGIATQKPVALAEMIIKALSNPKDLVLDCFLGSGTTLIAAHRLNRNGIGFEQFSDNYEIARKRLEVETR